ATPAAVKMAGRFEETPISTVNVAHIICQPLLQAMRQRLQSGRAGGLLARGDFIDGEFRGLGNNQVTINSILFRRRTYDTTREVLAVVLREVALSSGHYEIQLRDRSQVCTDLLRLEPDGLVIEDAVLGRVKLSVEDLAEIKSK